MSGRAVTLIVNPQAGGLLDKAITAEDIAREFRSAGFDVELLTGEPTDLDRLADQAIAAPADLIAVAGGDGTVNAIARKLTGTDKTLAVVPCGTLNRLSRDLDIPGKIGPAVAAIRDGEPIDIDVGEMNGQIFLCSSMIGFTSRLAGQRERWRGRLNPWTWIRLFGKLSRTLYRDPRILVRVADPSGPPIRTRHLAVAVGGYQEAPGEFFTRERLDAGTFGVYGMRGTSPPRLFGLLVSALAGRWRSAHEITAIEARDIRVLSRRPRLRVMCDGEIQLVEPPIRYTIRRGGLRVIRARRESQAEPVAA